MDLHLKPCPHCGSEAKLNTITDDPERPDYQGNYIACEACGATTQLMFSTGEDCRPVLAELWNARHSETPQAERRVLPGQRLAEKSKTMDLQDHPLKLGDKIPTAIYTASDEPVCVVDSMHERADDSAVARRIVVCWNACMGISTQSLASMPGHYFGAVGAQARADAARTHAEAKPSAWIDNSGHPHHLSYVQGVRERQLYGALQPLYGQDALTAAVAAERERCAQLCEQWNATPGHKLAREIRGA